MSSKGRIDSVADIQKIESEIKTILSGLSLILEKLEDIADKSAGMKFSFSGAKNVNDLNNSFIQLDNITNEAASKVNKLTKAEKDLASAAAALDKQRQAGLAQLAKQEAKERELQAAINREIKSIDDLAAQTAALTIVRRRLDKTTEDGKKKFDEYTQKIKANYAELKKQDADIGKFQLNVGNYTSAWGDLAGQFGVFGNTLPKVSSGLNILKVGFTTLKGAIISTGIGALVIAIITLVQWFKNTAVGAEALRKIMVPVNAIFETIGETMEAVGGALSRIFSGDFTGGWKELKGAVSGVNAEFQKQLVLSKAIKDLTDYEHKKYLEDVIRKAQLETQIAEQREIANNDQEYSLNEQIEAIDKAKKLTEELYKIKLDETNRAAALAVMQKQQGKDSEAEQKAQADAVAEAIRMQGEYADAMRSLSRRQNSLYKERVKNEKEADEAGKKAKEEYIKLTEESLQREVAISTMKLSLVRKGSDEELLLKYDLLKKQEALEVFQAEKSGQDIADIRLKYAKKWIEETLAASIKGIDEESRASLMAIDKSQAEELKQLRDQLENKEINLEEFEKRRSAIETKYDIQRAENAINLAKLELDAIEAAGGDTLAAREKLAKAEIDLDNLKTDAALANIKTTTDEQKKADEKVLESRKKVTESLIDLGQELFNTLQAFSNAEFETKFQKIDLETSKDQQAKESELVRAGKNEALKDQINAKYEQKQKQRDAQRRKLEIEQAKAARQFALMQIGINTAQAIMKIWAEVPKGDYGIATIALTAIAAGIGLAQAGAVASTPLPKYRTGRKGGPAELAIVGEVGSELITYDDGTMALTPPKPTVTFLPAGASVTPHHDLMNNPGLFMDRKVASMPDKGFDTRSLENKIDSGFNRLADTVKNKQEHHWNITEKGFSHMVRNGQAWSSYISKKHRS